MSLVNLHVIVIYSCTTLKELLIERRKTMGCLLIFCCDKFNFWYILIIFRVVIFNANQVISLRPMSQKKEAHKTLFLGGIIQKLKDLCFQGSIMNLKCIFIW